MKVLCRGLDFCNVGCFVLGPQLTAVLESGLYQRAPQGQHTHPVSCVECCEDPSCELWCCLGDIGIVVEGADGSVVHGYSEVLGLFFCWYHLLSALVVG